MAQASLRNLGVDTKVVTPKTLPAVLVTLKGKQITIQTKQNKEFFNIYFRKPASKPKQTSRPGTKKPVWGRYQILLRVSR